MHTSVDRRDPMLERRLFDRRLFTVAAILFPLIVLVGFGRTYYLASLAGSPPLPSVFVHVHGLLMTCWVVLFIAQVRLIATKRIRLHQRLGYASIGLAALIILTGVPVAVRAAKYGSASTPSGIDPLAFMLVPMFDLLMFALFFSWAIYVRRKPAAHKSLMLLTALNFLPPAVARVPVAPLLALGPLWFFGVPTVLAVTVLVLERRREGRVNRVLAWGTGLLVASYVVRLTMMMTAPWMAAAAWLTGFV